uniref:Uncharacterized protein n=1 Tax=Lepeophtheirus salmonis TaxID=72036 RepID=A0A0K2V189_LEPSM
MISPDIPMFKQNWPSIKKTYYKPGTADEEVVSLLEGIPDCNIEFLRDNLKNYIKETIICNY